jgi:hypothetical protein
VLERNNEEKKKIRDERRASKLSVSLDTIVGKDTSNKNKIGVKSSSFGSLFSDELFD